MISPNQLDYGTNFPAVYCYDPHWKTVDILGSVEIKDDEPIDDVKKTFNVSKKYIFSSEHVTHYFDFDECVGGEVRVVISSSVQSNNDGSATFVGTIYLYEGTSCDRGMLRKALAFNEKIFPMQTLKFYQYVLNDTDVFGGDYAKVRLDVTNYHQQY